MKRVVFGNEHGLARITRIEHDLEPYILADSWENLLEIAGDADLVVQLLAPSEGKQWKADRWVDQLHAFREQHRDVPLMLVVSRLPNWIGFLGRISDLRIEETAYWDETSAEMQLHISRASQHSFRNEILAECKAADLPAPVVEILTAVMTRWPPFTSEAAVAHELHVERRTLNARWQPASTGSASVSLKHLVDWVLLLHAYRLKSSSATWQHVANALGVRRDRVREISNRYIGSPPRELATCRPDAVKSLFRARVLDLLIGQARGARRA